MFTFVFDTFKPMPLCGQLIDNKSPGSLKYKYNIYNININYIYKYNINDCDQ